MSQTQIQVTVEKEMYDVFAATIKAYVDAKAAVKSGATGVMLVSEIGSALVADLAPVIAEVAQLPGDISESLPATIAAVLAQLPALIAAVKS